MTGPQHSIRRALVVGASGGIGGALAEAIDATGAEVARLSRRADGLDVIDEVSVEAALSALDGPFDMVLVTTGALEIDGAEPEKTLKSLTADALTDQFRVNAMGPALVLKHAVRLLPREGRAVFAALSARVGSIGDNRLGGWYSYRAAKAALNQLVHTASIELARSHPDLICAALHPGTVTTAFTEKYLGRHPSVPPAEAAGNLLQVLDGLIPEDSGGFFDWAGKRVAW